MTSLKNELELRRIPTQERAVARVEQILEAAEDLLVEQGVAWVTTARIAARAGVPIGSVYQYFPNKQAIFGALYERSVGGPWSAVEEFLRDGPYDAGPREFLSQLIVEVRKHRRDPAIQDAVRVACEAFPELKPMQIQFAEKLADPLAQVLRRLGSRWPLAKLRRLVLYVYHLNEGGLRYRREFGPPARELSAWADYLMLQALLLAFAD